MSDKKLTDPVLADLRAKAQAAQAAAATSGDPATLAAFQGAASPDVVLALLEEVEEAREAERKRQNNYDWLAKARAEGKAVSLGRSGWALPPNLKKDGDK